MKVSAIVLGFAAAAVATPFSLEARADNAAAVLADLNKLASGVVALNKTINSFATNAGSIPGNTLVKLQNQNTAIENTINAATKSTTASSAFTNAEAQKIIAAILNIQPQTFSLLNNVVAHKQAFDNSDVTSIVVSDLTDEKNDVAKLGPAIVAKVPQQYKSQGPAIEQNFATHFQNAINALNGS